MQTLVTSRSPLVLVTLFVATLGGLTAIGAVLANAPRPWHDQVALSPRDTVPMRLATPDEALERGEAVLLSKYGRTVIAGERPITAILRDGVWTVSGTLPPHSLGGVATVELSATDGRVVRVYHPL
jgi:hypothetical protein